jgi:oxaloacetate decarboxylase alpha subunit
MLVGKYGRTTMPVNKEVQQKALDSLGMKEPITYRPADDLEPSLEKFEKEMAQYKEQDEDVLSYALFPQVATDFFKYREAQKTKVDSTLANSENKTYPV